MCERAARVECVFERAKQLNIAAAAARPFALPLSPPPPRPGPRFPHRTRPSGSPGRNRRRQRRRRRRPPPLSTNETPPLGGDGGRRTGCRGCARARSGEGEMKTELHQEEWGQLTSHAGGTGRRARSVHRCQGAFRAQASPVRGAGGQTGSGGNEELAGGYISVHAAAHQTFHVRARASCPSSRGSGRRATDPDQRQTKP